MLVDQNEEIRRDLRDLNKELNIIMGENEKQRNILKCQYFHDLPV